MHYDDLTREEQVVLEAFMKLMNDVGEAESFLFFNKTEIKECHYCIYKENNKWISYIYENGEKKEYHECDNLYRLCINIFESLSKKERDYCLKNFAAYINGEMINKRRVVR